MSEEIERVAETDANGEESNVEALVEATTNLVVDNKSVSSQVTAISSVSSSSPTENVIVESFVKFFEPLIKNLDANVESLRLSQCDLTNHIKNLLNQISKIYDDEKKKLELDEYTKRLNLAKKRLNSVQAIIIAVQERLNRIYVVIQRDPIFQQQQQQH